VRHRQSRRVIRIVGLKPFFLAHKSLKVNHTNTLYALALLVCPHKDGLSLAPNKVPHVPTFLALWNVSHSAKYLCLPRYPLPQFDVSTSRVASWLPELNSDFCSRTFSARRRVTGTWRLVGWSLVCIALLKCQLVGVQLILVPALARRNVFKSNKYLQKKVYVELGGKEMSNPVMSSSNPFFALWPSSIATPLANKNNCTLPPPSISNSFHSTSSSESRYLSWKHRKS